jgi:hypothetical protein
MPLQARNGLLLASNDHAVTKWQRHVTMWQWHGACYARRMGAFVAMGKPCAKRIPALRFLYVAFCGLASLYRFRQPRRP